VLCRGLNVDQAVCHSTGYSKLLSGLQCRSQRKLTIGGDLCPVQGLLSLNSSVLAPSESSHALCRSRRVASLSPSISFHAGGFAALGFDGKIIGESVSQGIKSGNLRLIRHRKSLCSRWQARPISEIRLEKSRGALGCWCQAQAVSAPSLESVHLSGEMSCAQCRAKLVCLIS
jgi:hypothetical protein